MRLKLTQAKSTLRLVFVSAFLLALSTQSASAQEQREASPQKLSLVAKKKAVATAGKKTVAVRPVKVQANQAVVAAKPTKSQVIQQKLAATTDVKEKAVLESQLKVALLNEKAAAKQTTVTEVPVVDPRRQKASLTVPAVQ